MADKPRFVGERVKLGDVLQVVNGKNQKAVEDENGQYPIYGSGGQMGWASSYICPANTVIIGRKGNINKPIYVSEPFWNVDTAFGLVAKPGVLDARYLYHFCRHFDFEKLNTTCTIPSLTRKNIEGILLRLPSFEKQKEMTARFDSILKQITLARQQLSSLDALVKSRFVEMFGDLDSDDSRPLKDVCSIITDGTHQPPKFVDEGIPFLFVSNIASDVVDYETNKFISAEDYERLIHRTPIEIGDVLVSAVGSFGHPAVVRDGRPFCFQRHIAYLKPRHNLVDSDYLHAVLLSDDAQRYMDRCAKGVAQRTVTLKSFKEMKIPVPSMCLQEEFAAFVALVDKSRFIAQQQIEKLQMLYDSLAQEYFA